MIPEAHRCGEVGSCRWKAPGRDRGQRGTLGPTCADGIGSRERAGDPGRQAPLPRNWNNESFPIDPRGPQGWRTVSEPGDREEDGRVGRPVRRSQRMSRWSFGGSLDVARGLGGRTVESWPVKGGDAATGAIRVVGAAFAPEAKSPRSMSRRMGLCNTGDHCRQFREYRWRDFLRG